MTVGKNTKVASLTVFALAQEARYIILKFKSAAINEDSFHAEIEERHPQADKMQVLVEANRGEEGVHVLPLVKVRRNAAGGEIDHEVQHPIGQGERNPRHDSQQR